MASIGVALVYRGENFSSVVSSVIEAEVVNSSAVSAQSTIVADGGNQFWEISSPVDVWVRFGSNPTAAAGDDLRIWAGTTRHFQAKDGDKVAVIDA